MSREAPSRDKYEVEKILDHDRRRGYLVRWAGYDESADSWVAKHDIHQDLVKEYEAGLQKEKVQSQQHHHRPA